MHMNHETAEVVEKKIKEIFADVFEKFSPDSDEIMMRYDGQKIIDPGMIMVMELGIKMKSGRLA